MFSIFFAILEVNSRVVTWFCYCRRQATVVKYISSSRISIANIEINWPKPAMAIQEFPREARRSIFSFPFTCIIIGKGIRTVKWRITTYFSMFFSWHWSHTSAESPSSVEIPASFLVPRNMYGSAVDLPRGKLFWQPQKYFVPATEFNRFREFDLRCWRKWVYKRLRNSDTEIVRGIFYYFKYYW
jgi:hypothetical protein